MKGTRQSKAAVLVFALAIVVAPIVRPLKAVTAVTDARGREPVRA